MTAAAQRRAGVLVDCDGTLLDTTYLHTVAWSRALRDLDAWAPMNAIHRLVGMGGDHLVPELLGHALDGANEAHDRHYAELQCEMKPFPGAGRVLHDLADAGLLVVLASSAPAGDLDRMRRLLDADDALAAVITADDVDRTKPDPQIFEVARDRAGIDRARVIAIGDSVWDVHAARAAGMGCVGVESGGFGRHELIEAGAVVVYRDIEEVGAQMLTGPIGTLVAATARR